MHIHQNQPQALVIATTPVMLNEAYRKMHASTKSLELASDISVFEIEEKT